MLRTVRVTSRVGTASVNVPSSLIVEPMVVPATDTCPDVTGSADTESVTLPGTIRVCAQPVTEPTANRSAANTPERYAITRALPSKPVTGRDHVVKITRRSWGGLDRTAPPTAPC